MMSFNCLVLAASVLSVAAQSHKFSVCDDSKNDLGVTEIDVPDPVKVGIKLQVKFSGTTKVDFSAGKAHVKVLLFGVDVTDLDFDICKDMGVQCPKKAGDKWTGTVTYPIPKLPTPFAATVTIQIEAKDATGKVLSCVSVDVKVTPAASLLARHAKS